MNDDLGLRGPKSRIIMSATVGEKILHAIAYRDIFDKSQPATLYKETVGLA